MISDYYFVRKGYLKIEELYSSSKQGVYYFTFGVNWRAYVAYIAGILINVVGFAGAVGARISTAAQNMYHLNFYLGFIISAVVYYGLCKLCPVPACGRKWSSEVVDDNDKNIILNAVDVDTEEQNHNIKSQDQKVVDEVSHL
jgi:NCS1 family nucleobase:cation symporter-1